MSNSHLGPYVLFLWPPAASTRGPPFGLSLVAGHLRTSRPDVLIQATDLNIKCARAVLDTIPPESELHRIARSRWTQAGIIQDALSRWAFGDEAPAGTGSLPDWECHLLARIFTQTLDDFLESLSAPDLVGISVCDNGLIAAIGLSRKLRKRFPNTKIVWGGVSASEYQAPALMRVVPEIDAIVVGEGESAIVNLVDALPGLPEGNSNILVRDGKVTHVKAARAHYLPSEPAFDLFDLRLYPALELPMSIGRGCGWGHCSFCNENYATSSFQRADPVRSAQWAVKWQRAFQPVSFELIDSAANSNRDDFRKFVQVLLETGGLREWRCMMRTADADSEDIRLAVNSGLRSVYFGIESLDDNVLRAMKKGETVAHHLNAFRIALENGLQVDGDLIFFFPTDRAEHIERVIKLIRRYEHIFSRIDMSYSRFVPGLRSDTSDRAGHYGIRILHHSLRLAPHLPPELASALVPWDPYWEHKSLDDDGVIALGVQYLELQQTVATLANRPKPNRYWYDLNEVTVLEHFDPTRNTLDRIFLEGAQRKIWHAITRPRTRIDKIAKTIKVSTADATAFASALAERGFLFGEGRLWTRTALAGTPRKELQKGPIFHETDSREVSETNIYVKTLSD